LKPCWTIIYQKNLHLQSLRKKLTISYCCWPWNFVQRCRIAINLNGYASFIHCYHEPMPDPIVHSSLETFICSVHPSDHSVIYQTDLQKMAAVLDSSQCSVRQCGFEFQRDRMSFFSCDVTRKQRRSFITWRLAEVEWERRRQETVVASEPRSTLARVLVYVCRLVNTSCITCSWWLRFNRLFEQVRRGWAILSK